MDVKACDSCKKLNTELPLFGLSEHHRASVYGDVPQPKDPLIGFRLVALGAAPRLSQDEVSSISFIMLCKHCAEKKIAELILAL